MSIYDNIPEKGITYDKYHKRLVKASESVLKKVLGKNYKGNGSSGSLEHPIHWILFSDIESLKYVSGKGEEESMVVKNEIPRKEVEEKVKSLFRERYRDLITARLNKISEELS